MNSIAGYVRSGNPASCPLGHACRSHNFRPARISLEVRAAIAASQDAVTRQIGFELE